MLGRSKMINEELDIKDSLGIIIYNSFEGLKILSVKGNEEITLSGPIYIKGYNFTLEKEENFHPNFDEEGRLNNVEKFNIIHMRVL
jgi:hypothetical protein